MAIARWSNAPADGAQAGEAALYDAARKMTEQAVEKVGGIGEYVSRGDVVWVKPNIGWTRRPELAANTHPAVVATLVALCKDAGAKEVKVGDHTCNEAEQTYAESGVARAVKEAGGEMVYLDDNRYRDVTIDGDRLDTWPVYGEMLEADALINVPVAKHHGLAELTCCMKNYMGVIGGNRGAWHQSLPDCLVDITRFMRPRLSLVDATRVLVANGPTGGSMEDVRFRYAVAAGTDIVALDAFGAEMIDRSPMDIPTIGLAEQKGLGTSDYRSLAEEITVA
jgi:uncharacterized protein (DUF362 family)